VRLLLLLPSFIGQTDKKPHQLTGTGCKTSKPEEKLREREKE